MSETAQALGEHPYVRRNMFYFIYCITLLSASTVDSMIDYIWSFVESRSAAPLVSKEEMDPAGQHRGFCLGMNPREWKSFGEQLRCVSVYLTRQ